MISEVVILAVLVLILYFPLRRLMSKYKRERLQASKYGLPSVGNPFTLSNKLHFFFMEPPIENIPISTCIVELYTGWAELYRKEGLYHTRFGNKNLVVLFSGATVEPLLSSKTEIIKSGAYKPAVKFMKGGLVLSTGERWRKNRKLLTPAFHFNILEDFLPVINFHSKVLVEKLNSYVDQKFVDITPLILLCTFDIILETSMGTRQMVQNNPDSMVLRTIKKILETWIKRAFQKMTLFDAFFEYTETGKEFNRNINALFNFVGQIIKERKRELVKSGQENNNNEKKTKDDYPRRERKAFLDLLLTHQINDRASYTDAQIIAETNTFIGAGYDTTAMGVIWCVYLLGLNQDAQDKAAEEILTVLDGDRERIITADDLREMKYLDRVLKETQRLYPSVPMISRILQDNLKIGNVTIPKDSVALVLFSVLHRDPNVFPNPDVFDPDRFALENSSGRHAYAYAPFSAGPRNCIGQKFAILEEKIIMADILRNFRVTSLDPRDKIQVVPEIVGKPNKPIRIKLTHRN